MSEIRLIACDIGGTLITDDNVILNENIKAIEYAKSKGILIALATARMYSSTKYISNKIGCDYGVFSNGSHIMDIKKMITLKKTIMAYESVRKIIEYARSKKIYIHLNEEFSETSEEVDYFALKHILLNQNYEGSLKSNIKVVDDLLNYISKSDIMKVILASQKYLDEEVSDIMKLLPNGDIFVTEYYKDLNEKAINKIINYVEFSPSKDNKAIGLLELASMLKITPNEIMAIGDQDNDIEMLQNIKYSVGMANGTAKVKTKAMYVTHKDNNNGGLAEAIYKFVK